MRESESLHSLNRMVYDDQVKKTIEAGSQGNIDNFERRELEELKESLKQIDPKFQKTDELLAHFNEEKESFGDPRKVIGFYEFMADRQALRTGRTIDEAKHRLAELIMDMGNDDPVISEALRLSDDPEKLKQAVIGWVKSSIPDIEYDGQNINLETSSSVE